MTDNIDKTLGLALKPLRDAMIQNDISEDTVVKELKKLISSENLTAKARGIEILARWCQFNAPEKHIITEEVVTIEGEPEDLDI